MTIGVTRKRGPAVDGDEDFLVDELRGLAGAQSNAREGAREGCCEDGLLGKGSEGRSRERGAVKVTYVADFTSARIPSASWETAAG